VISPGPTRSSRWLGRRELFRVGRVGIPSYAAMLYLGFVAGVVLGGYESGLGYPRFTVSAVILLAGPQELVHFFARVDFICALQWHPTQLVAGRRVQCPASNSMGRVVGPLSAVSGFHGAGPVRRALGMRRVITARASANSRRARWAPRQ
jgi:hypothetical protein